MIFRGKSGNFIRLYNDTISEKHLKMSSSFSTKIEANGAEKNDC